MGTRPVNRSTTPEGNSITVVASTVVALGTAVAVGEAGFTGGDSRIKAGAGSPAATGLALATG